MNILWACALLSPNLNQMCCVNIPCFFYKQAIASPEAQSQADSNNILSNYYFIIIWLSLASIHNLHCGMCNKFKIP